MSKKRTKYKKLSLKRKASILAFMEATQGSYTMRGWADEFGVTISVIRNFILYNNLSYIRSHMSEEKKNKLLDFIRANPEKTKSELASILDVSFFVVASMCRRYSLETRPTNPDPLEEARRRDYFLSHPHETRREIARGLGLSLPTVVAEIRRHGWAFSRRSLKERGMKRISGDPSLSTKKPEASPVNILLSKGW